ncbi:MAG: HNH endonuclease, partial [Labilithrix sp.]|nr:HNH endonuclease [Labilithrix sp.]
QLRPGAPRSRWQSTRKRVYERDAGRCHLCGATVEFKHYECSHIIDRCVGGPDEDFNLVVMCASCNRRKPVHCTRSEYFAWTNHMAEKMRAYVATLMGTSA